MGLDDKEHLIEAKPGAGPVTITPPPGMMVVKITDRYEDTIHILDNVIEAHQNSKPDRSTKHARAQDNCRFILLTKLMEARMWCQEAKRVESLEPIEAFEERSPGYNIMVNGVKMGFSFTTMHYERICNIAGMPDVEGAIYSVTYHAKEGPQGILPPGQWVRVTEGMVFNVADTSQA